MTHWHLADARRLVKWCAAAALGAVVMTATFAATVSYTYDEHGRLKRVTYADGSYIDYSLDAASNRTAVTNASPPVGTLQLSASAYSVSEAGTSITITATRTGGSYGNVGVSYATGTTGTATSGSDYTATSGVLSWAHGETANKTFPVTIVNDATFEADETFNVLLSSPTGGATLGAPSSAWVTIVDNDLSVPTVPTNLRTSPVNQVGGNGSHSVLWNASSGPVAYYVLERSVWDANFSPPSSSYTVNAPNTFRNMGVTSAGEYYYQVKACTAGGQCSAYAAYVMITSCNPECL